MERKLQMIRLASAFVLALASAYFVYLYPLCYMAKFQVDHPEASLSPAANFLVHHSCWALALPLTAAIASLASFSSKHGSALAVQAVVSLTWLFSLLAVGASVLVCHMAATPGPSYMHRHF
jgi:hypothetical protein